MLATVDVEELKRELAGIRWWHRIDLGHGIVTPGEDPTPEKLERLRLPASLAGKTVLDYGAWDGFFSFEAERRGAARVLAADSAQWEWSPASKSGFELARRALRSRVEDLTIELEDLSPEKVGVFDLVLFLGVLYHVRDPLGALERIASVTGEQLILETHVDLLFQRRPALAFYRGAELADGPSNWFGPNPAAVVAMLHTVGFRRVELVWRDSLGRRLGRVLRQALVRRRGPVPTLQQARLVVHAWK